MKTSIGEKWFVYKYIIKLRIEKLATILYFDVIYIYK